MKKSDSQDLPPAIFAANAATAAKKGGSHEKSELGESHSESMLTAGLRAVAEDDERFGSSGAVGLRLLAEVQAIADAKRRRTLVLALSAAAAVLIAVLVPTWRSWHSAADQAQQADAPVITRELVTEFFPLTYSNVPARGGYVVRMQVPRAALASFGAAIAGDTASPNVLADVVIGNDGLARAVRFVQVISDRSPAEAGHHEQEQTP
jgi:hypothetical protein